MSTKEMIAAEIETLSEEDLNELHAMMRKFAAAKTPAPASFMDKLCRIQLDAPEDFAANLNLYASGEKPV